MRGRVMWAVRVSAASVVAAVLVAVGLAGCGSSQSGQAPQAPAGLVASSSASPSASPGGTPAVSPTMLPPEVVVEYPKVSDLKGVDGRPAELSVQRFVLSGSWGVRDYTDRVCALQFNTQERRYPQYTTYLFDLATGRKREALDRPVNAAGHYQILGARISDRWIAWEEVGPGDDLMVSVDWSLYAARYDPRTFAVGRPMLIDSGRTRDRIKPTYVSFSTTAEVQAVDAEATIIKGRPLFDLSGDTLCWMTNVSGAKAVGRVQATDLRRRQSRVVYETEGSLRTLSTDHEQLLVTEMTAGDAPTMLLSVIDGSTRDVLSRVDLGAEYDVGHFPAVKDGLLAWAVFSQGEENMFPALYARDRVGTYRLVARSGHDPVFVGDWLFFVQNPRVGTPGSSDLTSEVNAIDCRSGECYTLAKGGYIGWLGGFGAPATEHTFVAHDDRALGAEPGEKKITLLDVYRVR